MWNKLPPVWAALGGLALLLSSAGAPVLRAQPEGPARQGLQLRQGATLRMAPLGEAEYAAGYSQPVEIELHVSPCTPNPASPTGTCILEILGLVPFEGHQIGDLQWSTRLAEWHDLESTPQRVAELQPRDRPTFVRVYVRTRIDYETTRARPIDARALVRFRLSS